MSNEKDDKIMVRLCNTNEEAKIASDIHNDIFPVWKDYLVGREPILIATDANNEIGSYLYYMDNGDSYFIGFLGTKESARGQGYATALIKELIKKASENAIHGINLTVRVPNMGARALYSKLGFTEATIIANYYHDNGDDAVVYEYDCLKKRL